jgi:hypothetical protein
MPSPTLQAPMSCSPTLEEQGVSVRSPPPALPPNTPSSGDSDEDRILSPSQGSSHSPAVVMDVVSMEVGGTGGGAVDMNTEFPPLAMPHSRSKSEPQVTSLPAKAKSRSSCDDITPLKIQAAHAEQAVSVTSSWPMVTPLSIPSNLVGSENVLSPPLPSEKLPFVPSPPPVSPNSDTGEEEGESSDDDHTSPKTTTAATMSDGSGGVASSLAVGTRPSKGVAVTQSTQQVCMYCMPNRVFNLECSALLNQFIGTVSARGLVHAALMEIL